MTEPLTNASHDISGIDGFILNAERLMASELWALSSGDEFKAAVGLWCRAWKQVPPGSLPNDDKVLAAFSGAGKNWRKVRDGAMRGFILCTDGRLYHPVLCADVIRAAEARAKRNERTRAATEARNNKRNDQRNDQRNVQRDDAQNGNVTKSQYSPVQSREVKIGGVGSARATGADLERLMRDAAGWQSEPHPNLAITGPIEALYDAGATLELDILPTIRALAPQAGSRTSWKFFIAAIRRNTADRLKNLKPISMNEAGNAKAPKHAGLSRSEIFGAIKDRLAGSSDRENPDSHGSGGTAVVELSRDGQGFS